MKNPQFKITLDTNRVPPQMQQLFDDIVAGKGELANAGNVLSFQYYNTNSCDVTILVSKNAGRYRIQVRVDCTPVARAPFNKSAPLWVGRGGQIFFRAFGRSTITSKRGCWIKRRWYHQSFA